MCAVIGGGITRKKERRKHKGGVDCGVMGQESGEKRTLSDAEQSLSPVSILTTKLPTVRANGGEGVKLEKQRLRKENLAERKKTRKKTRREIGSKG